MGVDRRDLLKLIAGAVAVAVLPLPVALPEKLKPRYIKTKDAAFVEFQTEHDCRTGDVIILDGIPIGVATEEARAGEFLLVQVYGPAIVRVG